MAGSAERPAERPLSPDAIIGDVVVDGRQYALRFRVVGAALDADHRLTGCRQDDFGRNCGPGPNCEPLEAGGSKQGRVDLAGFDLLKPGFDIAADRNDPEVGPQAQ